MGLTPVRTDSQRLALTAASLVSECATGDEYSMCLAGKLRAHRFVTSHEHKAWRIALQLSDVLAHLRAYRTSSRPHHLSPSPFHIFISFLPVGAPLDAWGGASAAGVVSRYTTSPTLVCRTGRGFTLANQALAISCKQMLSFAQPL